MSDNEALTIDLDDPEFQEEVNYDPTQDMDARTPPPELDENGNVKDYIFKLSMAENKEGKKAPFARVSGKGSKYIALNVNAQVVAPGEVYDKSFVQFPFGGVSTMVYNGTTSMANLCRILGNPMPPKLSHTDQVAYMISLLESEPMVPGRLIWSGYCSNCKEDISNLTGERNWPEKKDESGKVIGHLSIVECPKCQANDVEAKPKIKKLVPAKV